MGQHTIHHEKRDNGGRFVIDLPGDMEAEMTYRFRNATSIVIDHTGVPNKFEGRGIAKELVVEGVRAARHNGWKIEPLCPYVALQFRRHSEWNDVVY